MINSLPNLNNLPKTWQQVIKLGKPAVIIMLKAKNIVFDGITHYFKLCSLLWSAIKPAKETPMPQALKTFAMIQTQKDAEANFAKNPSIDAAFDVARARILNTENW